MRIGAMHKVGLGELLERIERLKQQLIADGLTDPVRKKPLPFLPNKIGLVTGAKSDAEKDILQIAKSRWPDVQFEVAHTLVQGDRAAAEIIMALGQLDAMPDVDVIIVARAEGTGCQLARILFFWHPKLIRHSTQMLYTGVRLSYAVCLR